MERQPEPVDYLALLSLAILWGSAFLFIELALRSFEPLTVAGGRIGLGALMLLGFALINRSLGDISRRDLAYLAAGGLTGSTVPFALVAWGQQEVTSATAAILISFTPIATMVLGQVMTHDERITWHRLGGAALGIAGVAVLVGGPGPGTSAWRMLAIVVAASCYGISGLLFRRVEHLRPSATAGASMTCAAAVIVPAALIFEDPLAADARLDAVLAVAALGLLPTATATIIMVRLLYRTSATFVSFNNFLIPVMGSIMGVLILDESFTGVQAAGLAFILAGLALARRPRRRARLA
ncbi:MAG: DMT family transporter [Rhodothalassiaceae bacterium]